MHLGGCQGLRMYGRGCKQFLDQAAEWLILLEKIWKGVQDQLRDQLIPKLLELRWQSERT